MTQVEWGRDKDNYPVYYDEQVVGEIIAFESQRYNLMAKGDEKVLSLIDDSTNLYQDTAALKNQQPAGEFSKLEIGEIRQATQVPVPFSLLLEDNTAAKVQAYVESARNSGVNTFYDAPKTEPVRFSFHRRTRRPSSLEKAVGDEQ